jgi:hypothetical protein
MASSGCAWAILLALLHFGSMPTELCKNNIDLFAREVLPYLKDQWDDEYEDRWWPERFAPRRAAPAKVPWRRHGRRVLTREIRHG